MKIIMMGEPMGLFAADEIGSLSEAEAFTCSVAGAEFNVATGLSRLGHEAVYFTKLGADPIGERIRNAIKKNGILDNFILTDENEITGLMLKGKTDVGDPEIAYYRRGSAASKMNEKDADSLDISACEWLHVTGITPAISASAFAATERLIERCKRAGMFISFDPNLRRQLWASEKIMIETLNKIAGSADLVMPGISEGRILTGRSGEEEIAKFYHGLGAKMVTVKLGGKGAFFSEKEGESGHVEAFKVERIVDTVGAGDGFAAGVISGLAEKLSLKEATQRGLVIGAIQITHKSDNEALPTRAELAEIMKRGFC